MSYLSYSENITNCYTRIKLIIQGVN